MPTGSEAFLDNSPEPSPTLKKALCHTRPIGGTVDKYRYVFVWVGVFNTNTSAEMSGVRDICVNVCSPFRQTVKKSTIPTYIYIYIYIYIYMCVCVCKYVRV